MTAKKIIVTGGAGFIGSHLVERLLNDGHTVKVIDNFSTGRIENLNHLRKKKNLVVLKLDIACLPARQGNCNFQPLQKHFQGIDWVFHLAARADIVPSIVDPVLYHQSNVTGTVNVLEASRKAHVKRFLYAASSSCYGIPHTYPTNEKAPIRPQYPYALTKNLGEQYVLHFGQVYKLPVVSLRLFNVYGPRSRTSGTYGAVFGVFLAQKLAHKPFTVVGNGKQTRDFTFVTDVVNAFVTAANSRVTHEVFNVGSGDTYSVNRIIELLKGDVVYIPKRPGEPDCTFADISKIKKELGWKPKVKIEEGIQILLQNIDYWRQAPVWTPQKIKIATKEWFSYLG
jgi:UDP-glucose 4-epimerase